ncbi:hypothetical protein FZEAL_10890 [Fusarium zealandicum]|uniref:Uncharacterized protein n=1 Tax=Fusarium zealandicum TaxID=1053134 RepID=A0A8H4TTV8_9HYPO|nr:hypothetical protein FZEAL_10890 [Fusarium zealandicum]
MIRASRTLFMPTPKGNLGPRTEEQQRKDDDDDENNAEPHPHGEDENPPTKPRGRRARFIQGAIHCIAQTQPFMARPASLVSTKPEPSPLKWMIESCHVAPGYQAPHLQHDSPWVVQLTLFMSDLPQQLRSDGGIKAWRDSPSESCGEADKCAETCIAKGLYGSKFLFKPYADFCTQVVVPGRWLVLANVWCDSRQRLQSIDLRTKVSFETIVSIHAWEKVTVDQPVNSTMFYDFKRTPETELPDLSDAPFEMRREPPGYLALVPDKQTTLRHLIEHEGRALFCASHEDSPKPRRERHRDASGKSLHDLVNQVIAELRETDRIIKAVRG